MTKNLSPLEEILGVHFSNPHLLHQSLVHRSYLNENPSFELPHNERLEFLGDAVLELIATEHLYLTYPNPEGELTNFRAAIVNAKALSEIARELRLEDYLYLSRGEAKDAGSKARQIILANAIEAVIGALYLDQGMEETKNFIHRFIIVKLPHIIAHKLYADPKSSFQEAAQEKVASTPAYRVLEESGPDHAKHFVVGAYLGAEMVAQGEGTSKQEAQLQAAERALQAKGW